MPLKNDDRWKTRFEELQAYQSEHGDCNVGQEHPGGLRAWVSNQRTAWKNGTLPDDRQGMLERIGFEFLSPAQQKGRRTSPQSSSGNSNVAAVSQLNVAAAASAAAANTAQPAAAVAAAPTGARRKKPTPGAVSQATLSTMSAAVTKRPSISPAVRGRNDKIFETRIRQLRAFKAKYGHCHVPQSTAGGLGIWCAAQRQAKRKDILADDRALILEEVGFEWVGHRGKRLPTPNNPGGDDDDEDEEDEDEEEEEEEEDEEEEEEEEEEFDGRCEELEEYQREHGNCAVPESTAGGLGTWLAEVQLAKQKSTLSDEQIARLEAVPGFQWAPKKQKKRAAPPAALQQNWERIFDERLRELEQYKAEHGHTNVPQNTPGGLGTWCSNQRQAKRKDELSRERVLKLEAIGFQWSGVRAGKRKSIDRRASLDAPGPARTAAASVVSALGVTDSEEQMFQDRLRQLELYKAVHGNCDVPLSIPGGLGIWAFNIRAAAKSGELPASRAERLEQMGFSWSYSGDPDVPSYEEPVPAAASNEGVEDEDVEEDAVEEAEEEEEEEEDEEEPVNVAPEEGGVAMSAAAAAAAERAASSYDRRFDERFQELLEFKAKHGHVHVPQNSGSLGVWVATQRQRKRKNKIPAYQVEKLESVGFAFVGLRGKKVPPTAPDVGNHKIPRGHARQAPPTPEVVATVCEDTDEEDDEDVPVVEAYDIQDIGLDRGSTRTHAPHEAKPHGHPSLTSHTNGKVPAHASVASASDEASEKVMWTKSTAFRDRCRNQFEGRLKELADYKAEHGNCNVPQSHPNGLGIWVAGQRQAKRKNEMSAERMQILESMDFQWIGDRGRRNPITGQASSSNKKQKVTKNPPAKKAPQAGPSRGVNGNNGVQVGATTVNYPAQAPAPAGMIQDSNANVKVEAATTTAAAAAAVGDKPRRKMSKMGSIQLRLGMASLPSATGN